MSSKRCIKDAKELKIYKKKSKKNHKSPKIYKKANVVEPARKIINYIKFYEPNLIATHPAIQTELHKPH